MAAALMGSQSPRGRWLAHAGRRRLRRATALRSTLGV